MGREEDRDPWADLLEQEADFSMHQGREKEGPSWATKLLDMPGCPKGGLPSLRHWRTSDLLRAKGHPLRISVPARTSSSAWNTVGAQ